MHDTGLQQFIGELNTVLKTFVKNIIFLTTRIFKAWAF